MPSCQSRISATRAIKTLKTAVYGSGFHTDAVLPKVSFGQDDEQLFGESRSETLGRRSILASRGYIHQRRWISDESANSEEFSLAGCFDTSRSAGTVHTVA